MATPFVRAAATADPVTSAVAKTLPLPSNLSDGDLVILYATSQTGIPSAGPMWEFIDSFGTGAGLTGYVWRWTAQAYRAGGTVTVTVPTAHGFAAGLIVIGDPGLGILRMSKMTDGPGTAMRCVGGLTFGAAFMTSNFGRKLVVGSSLTKVLSEGENGAGMYLSVRYGPGQSGTVLKHGITLPGEWTDAGGVMLDLVPNAETNSFTIVKGRPNRYLDKELVG